MVLNESQRKFAEEYVVSGNGTDAARRAGYSEHSAAQQAARLKNHEGVQRYMLELRSKKLQESIDAVNGAVMSREEVIHGLRAIAEHEDLTPSARVSAYRTIADVEGYLGKHTKVDPIAAMTGIKIEIKGADGSQVSLSTAQAVKQLTGGGE